MANLDELREGDWVRWDGAAWEVTGVTTYRESADYHEKQWELEEGSTTRYLVRSEEKKPSGTEVKWICTVETGIGRVQHQAADGSWVRFRETNSADSPPAKVRYDGADFSLEGETEGKAVDDEGDNVTKLTWDYYDASGRRNLAIEVWKCHDADYFEAYDGRVVQPSEFQRVPPPPALLPGAAKEAVGYLAAGLFACFFFLPIAAGMLSIFDVGAEYVLALMLPLLAAGTAAAFRCDRGTLAAACAAGILAGAALVKVYGLGHGYWLYASFAMALGVVCAELPGRLMSGVRRPDKAFAAGCSSLIALFIVSLAHYVQFAPRPHDLGMLFVVCLLPALPAAALFAVYLFLGRADEPA